MPVITKSELKGNAPETSRPRSAAADAPDKNDAAKSEASTARQAETDRQRAMSITPAEARDVGEAYVQHGAADRAAAKVNVRGANPAEQGLVDRIVVDHDGKVIAPEAAIHGGTVLTGAEAAAYRSSSSAKSGDAGEKAGAQTKNKARPARATKSRGAK